MRYQKFLLPHFMQFAGATLAAIGVIGLCFDQVDYFYFLAYVFISVGLLITAISKEKTEDEFISYLRMKSIFIIVLLCIVYAILVPITDFFLTRSLDLQSVGKIKAMQSIVSSAPVMTMLYLVLFKGSIILNSKKETDK